MLSLGSALNVVLHYEAKPWYMCQAYLQVRASFLRITNTIVLKPGFSGVGTRIETRNRREPISDHLAPKMEFWGQNRIEIEHFPSLRSSVSDQRIEIRIF